MGVNREYLGLHDAGTSRPEQRRALVLQRKAEQVRALAVNLVVKGAEVAWTGRTNSGEVFAAETVLSGPCLRPVRVVHDGRPHWRQGAMGEHSEVGKMTMGMEVPCRRCSACLRVRAAQWGARAAREWETAPRTWFGTLTFAPEVRYRAEIAARRRLGVEDLSAAAPVERFRALTAILGPEVGKYLKLLRKGLRAPRKRNDRGKLVPWSEVPWLFPPLQFRYLLTVEPHKDWFPHFHILVHEVEGCTVTKAPLRGRWKHGFSKWKLVEDAKAAFYAAKYLGKYSVARVNASGDYGETGESASQTDVPEWNLQTTLSCTGGAAPVRIDPPSARGQAPPEPSHDAQGALPLGDMETDL